MTAVVVQARLGGTRMPAKVLAPWCDTTILSHILDECVHIHADRHILATDYRSFMSFRQLALAKNYDVLIGGEHDVLGRFLTVVPKDYAWIVRICADSPFISAPLTNYLLEVASPISDLVVFNESIPHGLAGTIAKRSALQRLYDNDPTDEERTHVTLGLYDKREFVVQLVEPPKLSIDTLDEYNLLRSLL